MWRVHATPFHNIYHHEQSCGVSSSWEGWWTPPFSTLPLYELCGWNITISPLTSPHYIDLPLVRCPTSIIYKIAIVYKVWKFNLSIYDACIVHNSKSQAGNKQNSQKSLEKTINKTLLCNLLLISFHRMCFSLTTVFDQILPPFDNSWYSFEMFLIFFFSWIN